MPNSKRRLRRNTLQRDFTKQKRYWFLAGICGFLIGFLVIFATFRILSDEEKLKEDKEVSQEPEYGPLFRDVLGDSEVQQMVDNLDVGGWIPHWGYNEGLDSTSQKPELLNNISPVILDIDAEGEFKVKDLDIDEIDDLRDDNPELKIIPTIQGFDPDETSDFLNDSDNVDAVVKDIVEFLKDNDFHGLDLNLEIIYKDDKDEYYSFLEKLSKRLKYEDKKLTIPVLSKWGDDVEYNYLPETREVMDYAKLAEYADEIRIMAYDFTAASSATPGPIAPIEWVEKVLDYALSQAPKEKITLGIHLYGYAWPDGKPGVALTYRDIYNIRQIDSYAVDSLYSTKYEEGAIKYVQGGENYFGYYSTPESIQKRMELALEKEIKGVMFWRLGNDPL